MPVPLKEAFKYHPPTTQERIDKHKAVNEGAAASFEIIEASVKDPDLKKMAYYAVQQARMFANQGITFDDIEGNS